MNVLDTHATEFTWAYQRVEATSDDVLADTESILYKPIEGRLPLTLEQIERNRAFRERHAAELSFFATSTLITVGSNYQDTL